MTSTPARVWTAALIVSAVAAGATALAQEPAPQDTEAPAPAVETIARNCLGCHGPNGLSPGAMPTLAGKSQDYLAARLMEFRDGKRPSTIMQRIIKPFADEDIRNIAAWFAAEKVEVTR